MTTQQLMDDDRRWQAVLARDRTYNGRFVYAVRSTGIYCRPTCPSKRPGREQVTFFAQPEEAERHGFRPCRRCRPCDAGEEGEAALVRAVCRAIDRDAEEPPALARLAEEVGLSPHHLQRVFKRATGITPHQYAEARRLDQLKTRLQDGDDVTTALYAAGYGSSSRLYSQAPAHLGMTPATYRKGGMGMTIAFTVAPCSFGYVLVAGTERGICAVSLGDAPGELEAALHEEYPAATIRCGDHELSAWVEAVLQYLAGEITRLDLPLDVQTTAFKWRVWQALRDIPYGTTRSYSQVAAAIGQPAAVRAVARACATNPVALVVPCHRVVREDGHLGGYRWGIARKQALLGQEQAIAHEREEAAG